MSTQIWGPPVWTFLHTLCVSINDDYFTVSRGLIISSIIDICSTLPCPECSQHASQWLRKVDFNNVKTKDQLSYILFQLHNNVNMRLGKSVFSYGSMVDMYKKERLLETHRNFVRVFHTRGNMKLLNESFRRKFVLVNLQKLLLQGISNKSILCA